MAPKRKESSEEPQSLSKIGIWEIKAEPRISPISALQEGTTITLGSPLHIDVVEPLAGGNANHGNLHLQYSSKFGFDGFPDIDVWGFCF